MMVHGNHGIKIVIFAVGTFGLHPRTRPNGKGNMVEYGGIWWWYVVVINGSASQCCNVFQAAKTD
jgi:hypothetical protein